jgi:hypothetical protein
MMKSPIGPRAFLKKQGLQFEKSLAALDRAFINSFPPESRDLVSQTWSNIQMGIANVGDLYDLPQTDRQLALLVSHDANRMVESMRWMKDVVESLSPKSIFEVGCGAGYLLSYMRFVYPNISLTGLDRQDNLTKILKGHGEGMEIVSGDVFSTNPRTNHELIICDFGWDNHDIPSSTSPHSAAEIAGQAYCPGCSDDLIPHYRAMLSAWQAWGVPDAKLAVTGRLMDVTELRAFVLAAELVGWHLEKRHLDILRFRNLAGAPQKFPALVFSTESEDEVTDNIEFLVEAYSRS